MHRSEGVVYTIEAAAFRTAEGCCLCIAESMYPLGSKGILPCRRTRWFGKKQYRRIRSRTATQELSFHCAIPRSRRLHGIGAVHNVNSGKPCLDFFTKKEGGTFVPPSCKCQILAEVSLKQTSECFSVSSLVSCHLMRHFASLMPLNSVFASVSRVFPLPLLALQ